MGLTSWEHNEIRRSDVEVAQNYLTEQELDALNKIVTAYLDIAEVHTLNKEPMYMKDWLETIDDYLKMTCRDILTSSGHISHKQAIEKAHAEYDKYKNRLDDALSPVEKDFIESIGMLEQISDSSKVTFCPIFFSAVYDAEKSYPLLFPIPSLTWIPSMVL